MRNYVGLGIFGVGIALLVVTLDALGASSSEVLKLAQVFQPHSRLPLVGGITAVVAGLILAFRSSWKA